MRARALIAALAATLLVLAGCGSQTRVWATPTAGARVASVNPYYGVLLHWSGISIASQTGYYIACSTGGGNCPGQSQAQIADVTSSPYTAGNLACGTAYTLSVEAHDASASQYTSSATAHTSVPFPTHYTTPACPGAGSGTGLRVSAQNEPCANSTAATCANLVDASGNVVHMHGVDLSGTEYACIQNFGIFSGSQNSSADVSTMQAWDINFVRIQLNEDCWLGINQGGISGSFYDVSAPTSQSVVTGNNYANSIISFVNQLHAAGIYTEIVDMWNAPGTDQAVGQSGSSASFNSGAYYGPDEDHSPAMWASMAETFAGDPDTILSPAGEENVSMGCQMSGCTNEGLAATDVDSLGSNGGGDFFYSVAGLSQAVTVMRADGFDGPISLECAHFGGTCDCSQSGTSCHGGVVGGATWLADAPTDSLGTSQILAEVHSYGSGDFPSDGAPVPSGTTGGSPTNGWDLQQLPIIQAGVPLFFGEVGDGSGSDCTDDYVPHVTAWADAHDVGFMNWTWTVGTGDCYALTTSYTTGAVPTAASFTGTTTSGGTSIASVSSTTGLQVGQVITGSGLPTGDTIVAISGSTLTMGLQSTASASGVSLTAEQGNAGWVKAHDQNYAAAQAAPQTNISQGQSTVCVGSCSNPSFATDSEYGASYGQSHQSDCSGYPCGIAINLSSQPSGERQNVIVMQGNQLQTYDPAPGTGLNLFNDAGTFTVDACGGSLTACGTGSPPSSGWTTLKTVTGNLMGATLAEVNLQGATWIRVDVSAKSSNDASGNGDFQPKIDVISDNSALPIDSWVFLGDSVTENSMTWQDIDGSGTCCSQTDFMQTMHALDSAYYPTEFQDGIGSWPSENELGTDSNTGVSYFQDVINTFAPGHYMAIDYGGTNSVGGDCTTFQSDERTMIAGVVAAGYQPVSRYTVTWARGFSTGGDTTAESLNTLIHGPIGGSNPGSCPLATGTYLFMTYPTVVVGPDFWDFFNANTSLSATNDVHPLHSVGENAYRKLYDQTAIFNTRAG